jgi:hypothetical protein
MRSTVMPKQVNPDAEFEKLEKAKVIAPAVGVTYGVLVRMAHAGIVPCYFVGVKRTGLRFSRREVLQALKRPVTEV